jgi:RNA-directed DNA polymerase
MKNGLVSPAEEGTPQGRPLSPVLSNIVLNELDQELERRGHRFTRYADDCNIYVRSRRAGERVMSSVTRLLTTKLKLRVNSEKSAVARPWERKFLGFSFTNHKHPKRRLAPKAVARFKERVRELTLRTRGISLARMAQDAAKTAGSSDGPWHLAKTPALNIALSNAYFASLGLPELTVHS